jgi:DNA-binding PadR family transcriptional regulator
MLSNIEVMLLSILNERPSYAYEINKTIEFRNMRKWVKVGSASIYQVLKRLQKKDLVYSRLEFSMNRINRKRYYITDSGRNALRQASKGLISNIEWYYLDLNVGFEASDFMSDKERVYCLTKRLLGVTSNLNKMKEIYSAGNELEYHKKLIIRYLIDMREAEKNSLQETLQEMLCVNK